MKIRFKKSNGTLEAVGRKHQHESYISVASLFKHNSLLTTC